MELSVVGQHAELLAAMQDVELVDVQQHAELLVAMQVI